MNTCVEEKQRADSPDPSCRSAVSDRSKEEPINIRKEPGPWYKEGQNCRAGSPVPSCVSAMTDRSKEEPINFKNGPGPSHQEGQNYRAGSPVPSCVSAMTDRSKEEPINFKNGPGPSHKEGQNYRAGSPVPSCVSAMTDRSKEEPINFKNGPGPSNKEGQGYRAESPVPGCVSVRSDRSKEEPINFSNEPGPLAKTERVGASVDQQASCSTSGQNDLTDLCSYCNQTNATPDSSCSQCGRRSRAGPWPPASDFGLQEMDKILDGHKSSLRRRCESVTEGADERESKTRLNRIYTELFITERQSEEINPQHEVWQLETTSQTRIFDDTPIKCCDIFKALAEQQRNIRVVLTNGVAGVGKTFSVHKFTLDWAEGLENQDVSLLCLLSFRELNLIGDRRYSLLKLLHDFHPTLKKMTAEKLAICKALFIFDGLDESRLSLDFINDQVVTDVTHTTSVSVLMTNLIQGNLLPSALIWITSRPAAASRVPHKCVDRATEVRGFTDVQKEKYFRKRFGDKEPANAIISHIQESKSLHIMCQIPVFCWITATVLEHMLTTDQGEELPKTLTDMYSYFLQIQIRRTKNKYRGMGPQELQESDRDVLLKLGRLAFEHLQRGNIMFYQRDLVECGLDVTDASVYSGICTAIFKTENVVFQNTVYCFVHLSVQEFLAAVYMFHCTVDQKTEVLKNFLGEEFESWDPRRNSAVTDFSLNKVLRRTTKISLESKTGHLDLFVRFLHGLCLESNQRVLLGLLGQTQNSPEILQTIVQGLKDADAYMCSPDRGINIFHCLTEMNDRSVHMDIQTFLKSERKIKKLNSNIHCSALAHMLQMSEKILEEFNPKRYATSEEGQRRLISAVRKCRKARLRCLRLSPTHCEVVATALKSCPSHLRELEISLNPINDLGVQLLCCGLESVNCRLENLELRDCKMTEIGCSYLASALSTNPFYLRELILTNNKIQDAGIQDLCGYLQLPDCICVADPVQVSVNLPLSVDIPLPYQVVRGEQLELQGSVYNQELDTITYCVTLTVGPAICLLQSEEVQGSHDKRSTPCTWSKLRGGDIGKVTFTLLSLEPGEHTLTFTLKTRHRDRDIVEKKLRVVPEGVRKEEYSGGTLDPQGLYGTERREVILKNKLPGNVVPNTQVVRLLTINGEILDDILTVLHKPEGLKQLINLPDGSAGAEVGAVLTLITVYKYLETTASWSILGPDIQKNSDSMTRMIRQGLIGLSSFRNGDSSYNMWSKQKPSTWLTALVVNTMSLLDGVITGVRQPLATSIGWMIRRAQQLDGSFVDTSNVRPNKIMAAGGDATDRSVYLTSFVLIALTRATSIRDPILNLKFQEDSMHSAANYISQHALNVKSVYVRAVATYALTLYDPNSIEVSQLILSLEKLARQKGIPVIFRYWQESNAVTEWLKPDESSAMTVETTAYVLLAMLLKGRIPYANPILAWLSQDQHYGEGFFSVQDTVLTLQALTEYKRIIPHTVLDQEINVRYRRKGSLAKVELTKTRPVARPMEVAKDDDIIVSTGYGNGVSNVKLKTVYYETTASSQKCHFDITIEVVGPDPARNRISQGPHLLACVKYKPPPNEVYTESSMTVVKIQLPTGVEAYLEDLKPFRDLDESLISHYELQGSTVVIQMDAVQSDIFTCFGFRIRTRFTVTGVTNSVMTVYESQDKGSVCMKHFSYQEQKLQRLCMGEECQCMAVACATYRGKADLTLTVAKRMEETCRSHIIYAYKVRVRSSAAQGDFMTYTATVVEVLKNTAKEFEAVRSLTEIELIKKATCTSVDIQNDKQYLLMGSRGSEYAVGQSYRYRFPVDSEASVELLSANCDPPCPEYNYQLDEYTVELQLAGCPK